MILNYFVVVFYVMHASSDHYFSESPRGAYVPNNIEVWLGGGPVLVQTASGIFSPDGVDRGTRVLLDSLPIPTAGNILDIGCGWGPITIDAALKQPAATVYGIDVNTRSLELAKSNATRIGLDNVQIFGAAEVPDGLTFSEIRSNPPIRVGKKVLHEILETWLPRLEVGGVAYLVVAKHLGADSLAKWIGNSFENFEVTRHHRSKGFHVLKAERF